MEPRPKTVAKPRFSLEFGLKSDVFSDFKIDFNYFSFSNEEQKTVKCLTMISK